MNLFDNPILRTLGTIAAIVGGLVGLGYLAVFGVLIAVSLPDPSRKELSLFSENSVTTEIYVRNRTAVPLRVCFTVARAALRPDTVWWNLALTPEALGQALVLRDSLVTQGLRCPLPAPLPAPVLLPGTADTLVDRNFDDSLPRALVHRRQYRYHSRRTYVAGPTFNQAVRVWPVPGQPDSLRVELALAPDSLLRVGRHRAEYVAEGEANSYDRTSVFDVPPYPVPAPRVQWHDAQGRPHHQRLPLARWLPAPAPTPHPTGHHLVRRYWDYR